MPETNRERRLQRALIEAVGFLELNLPQRAVERLTPLAAEGGDRPQFNLVLGEALRFLDRHADALVHLERVREQSPEELEVYLALGWCYKRTNQLPLAIRALETAHRLQPDNDLILYNLACYHCLAGHKADTLSFLRRALAASPAWREHLASETDFDNLRQDQDFRQVVNPPSG